MKDWFRQSAREFKQILESILTITFILIICIAFYGLIHWIIFAWR